jgi:hypothetical protein
VRVYGVITEQAPDETVELFVRRSDADAFIAEVEADAPELARFLRVETIDLDQ